MSLHRVHHGGGPGTPLMIAHGLYGSARNWGVIAKRLSADRPVIALDMRNHGQSPDYPTHSYEDMAQDLADEIDTKADILGHSMGGKAAMVLALTRPDKVRRLIVADIAPVTYGHSQLPMIDAMESLDLTRVSTRKDADLALQAQVPEAGVRAFLLQSLDVPTKQWRLNLATLRAEMPKIMSFPDLATRFEGETLFLTGAESDYVDHSQRDRIKQLFPRAKFAKIPGAGHWLHAEKPREFEAAVSAFLKS